MSKLIPAALIVAGLCFVGCTRDDELKHEHDTMNQKAAATQSAGADACKMCPGVQTATADGKCPVCGMQVR